MLESIISPGTAERKPWDMVILAFIISSVAIWMAYYLAGYLGVPPSILALVVAVMALAPLMHRILIIEEVEEEACAAHSKPLGFITRHVDVVSMYSFLFVGLLISFSFWYVMLPYQSDVIPSGDEMFSIQNDTISGLQQQISGRAVDGEAIAVRGQHFTRLYNNNMRVMIFCFFASFLFGAGALWIMTWNASVIGVFIGNKIKAAIAMGTSPAEAYAVGFPQYSLGIALWAIPEVLAYLIAGIAGGIVSVAIARHHFTKECFWLTVFDATLLMVIAGFLVILGAYIEHFFLPV